MPTAKNPIQAARTTFRVVEGLRELDGAGVTELATHLDMSKSNLHNYLSTLAEEKYVVKEGTKYNVGLRFLDLGSFARQRQNIYEVAKSEVRSCAEETGELANLLVEEGGRGIYLYRKNGDQAVNVDARTGTRVRMHNTALGKAILAHFPPARVEQILDRHGMPKTTENTITTHDALAEELKQVREENVAFDHEERLMGLQCVAVPVVDNSGSVQGAISVSGPKSRMSGDRFETEIPRLLQDAANVIELNITYS